MPGIATNSKPTERQTYRSLIGRSALITGGGRGIGRAIALELASHGASVTISYLRSAAGAESAAREILDAGGRAFTCRADASNESEVANLVDSAARQFDGLDILVCNAGLVRGNLAATQSIEEWDATLRVNLTGPFLGIRAAIPHMITGQGGSIVCLSSLAADRGVTGLSSYAASKGGLNALVRSLAVELGRKRIRVNAVAPGLIDTEMVTDVPAASLEANIERIALRRIGQASEVAKVVRFLASDEASYITGEVIAVNGGLGV
ncbi:MAG: SDR family oxidoreductase [Acidobacteriaceae bacterium]|nr:SDR family oxidoreductase [Acidobacteriaceae bacterium]